KRMAELASARRELRHHAWAVASELRREGESGRRLLRPAAELLLGRKPVTGRVQLDGREPPGVDAQELLRVRSSGIELGPPRGVRPARGADMHLSQAVRARVPSSRRFAD